MNFFSRRFQVSRDVQTSRYCDFSPGRKLLTSCQCESDHHGRLKAIKVKPNLSWQCQLGKLCEVQNILYKYLYKLRCEICVEQGCIDRLATVPGWKFQLCCASKKFEMNKFGTKKKEIKIDLLNFCTNNLKLSISKLESFLSKQHSFFVEILR